MLKAVADKFRSGEYDHISRTIAELLEVDAERVSWKMMGRAGSDATPIITNVLETDKGKRFSNMNGTVLVTYLECRDAGLPGMVVVPQDEEAVQRLGSCCHVVGRGTWEGAQVE